MRQSVGLNGVPILTPILVRLKSGRCLSLKILLTATGSDRSRMVYSDIRDCKGNLFEVFSFDAHGSR